MGCSTVSGTSAFPSSASTPSTDCRAKGTTPMLGFRLPVVAVPAVLLISRVATAGADARGAAKCSAQQGQAYIDAGRYDSAVREFTCLVEADPTSIDGYRGRIEAELLLGRYSDGLADYARVTAFVLPVHPDAREMIRAGYAARLAADPNSISALTGASFERWSDFAYVDAIQLLNLLLDVKPNDVYGTLLRGSSRLLRGVAKGPGVADLEQAIALAPTSPDVRFVVADAYTYTAGQPDYQRAFAEARLALQCGLGTPRIHPILATAYQAFGDKAAAAAEIQTHIDLVTTQLVASTPLAAGGSLSLGLVPGRTYEIPVPVTAGQTVSVATSSPDFWDTI